jgi:XTP/dITP diphosphohydrolase
MPLQLVFATNNRHKLEEVSAQIKDEIRLLTLEDIGCNEDIEETGLTFEENASIKSRYVYDHYRLNCFGDDSGLIVDALNGEPGIYSARYAGGHGDHPANIKKILEKLSGIENRKAHFKSVISLIWNGEEHFFEGIVEGTIRQQPTGNGGFGYDPIFQPDGYDITFAEMSLEQKNTFSHRGRAVQKLTAFLNNLK